MKTRKHKEETMEMKEIKYPYVKIGNKTFKTESGLWKHKKTCKAILKDELREPKMNQ